MLNTFSFDDRRFWDLSPFSTERVGAAMTHYSLAFTQPLLANAGNVPQTGHGPFSILHKNHASVRQCGCKTKSQQINQSINQCNTRRTVTVYALTGARLLQAQMWEQSTDLVLQGQQEAVPIKYFVMA
jgi:hypothetical protein